MSFIGFLRRAAFSSLNRTICTRFRNKTIFVDRDREDDNTFNFEASMRLKSIRCFQDTMSVYDETDPTIIICRIIELVNTSR